MENDQAARLRAMVRSARVVEAAGAGPQQLCIVSLEGMAPQLDVTQFVSDLAAAAAKEGVRLAAEGAESQPTDWIYTLVVPPAGGVEGASLQRTSLLVALAETSPSSVLATYAFIKQVHAQGSLSAVDVVFAGDEQESEWAGQGLRGTCQRFLGRDVLQWFHWRREAGRESLQGLVHQLAQAKAGNSPLRNSLAEIPLERV